MSEKIAINNGSGNLGNTVVEKKNIEDSNISLHNEQQKEERKISEASYYNASAISEVGGGDNHVKDEIVNIYPDGGRESWLVCLGVVLMSVVSWGTNLSLSVYVSYYIVNEKESFDISRSTASLISAASTSLTFLTSIPSNYIENRMGIRKTLFIGVFLNTLGLFLTAFSSNFYLIIFFQAIVCGIGRGLLCTPIGHVLSQWFDTKLGIAMGISHAGSGIGGMGYSKLISYLLQTSGLIYSYHVINIITLVISIPGVMLIKSRCPTFNKTTGKEVYQKEKTGFFRKEAFASSIIIIYLVKVFFGQWFYTAARSILPTYYSEVFDSSGNGGANLQIIFSLGMTIGRLVISFFIYRVGFTRSTIILELVSIITAYAVWLPANNFSLNALNAFIQGSTAATVFLTSLPIISTITEPINVRSIMAMVWVVSAFSALFSLYTCLSIVDYIIGTIGKLPKYAYTVVIHFNTSFFIVALILSIVVHIFAQRIYKSKALNSSK